MVLEMKLENMSSQEDEDIIEDSHVEENALEAIREAKISLQMISPNSSLWKSLITYLCFYDPFIFYIFIIIEYQKSEVHFQLYFLKSNINLYE